MHLWLVEVPNGAIILCQILLINTIFFSLNPFIYYGIVATGRVQYVNVGLSITCVIFLSLFYFVLRLTHSYVLMYILNLFVSPTYTIIYIVVLKKILHDFDVRAFVLGSLIPLLGLATSTCILACVLKMVPMHPILQIFLALIICSSFTCLISYRFLLEANERNLCRKFIAEKFSIRKL